MIPMKKNKFVNIVRGKDYFIHNTLNGSIIKTKCNLSKDFIDMIDREKYFQLEETNDFINILKEMKIIVDDYVDEVAMVHYSYNQLQGQQLMITLIVTRQCNFRCVYCYEQHEDKKMKLELYDNILKAIERLIEQKGYKSIYIELFGGEPMLEYSNIVRFLTELKVLSEKKGITIFAGMTTNAYLLTAQKLKILSELGVYRYQITVDGLKETHDISRFLVNGEGTWDTIIKNLKDIMQIDSYYEILIRTNYNMDIVDESDAFFNFISETFMQDKRFNVHFEAVKKLGGENDINLNVVEDECAYSAQLRNIAQKYKLRLPVNTRLIEPFSRVCYAGKNDCFTVDYNGSLMKCSICIDNPVNIVGKITDNGEMSIDIEKHSFWTSYNHMEKCYDCKIFPICYGKKCPANKNMPEWCEIYIKTCEESFKEFYM